jgi:hypothetical protein
MSRSYKHTPYWGDDKSNGMKQIANRKVRRLLKDPDNSLPGKSYKKCFCSWNICDYYTIYPDGFNEYYQREIERWYQWGAKYDEPFPDRKICLQKFKKHYLNK